MMNLDDATVRTLMTDIPDIPRFLTVDELHRAMHDLADQFPDVARIRRVGSSTLGEPLHLLSIGDAGRNAFVFGCPHPNEPIGAMMVHHFTRLLCERPDLREALGYTWHFIPCVDPDGTRLNEPWFAGPFTISNYARWFYRPAPDEQVEWTFPAAHKRLYFDRSLRETQALMRVIDELQPKLMVSLHNSGFGGVYYYLSAAESGLYERLQAIPSWEDLPLNLGEPESPAMEQLAPAVFLMPSVGQMYDFMEAHGADPVQVFSGGSSNDYAGRYDTFTLVIETPYFDNPRVNDLSATDVPRQEAIKTGLEHRRRIVNEVGAHFDAVQGELRGASPFQRSVRQVLATMPQLVAAEAAWAEQAAETARPATAAELFDNTVTSRFYPLLSLGQLVRMLEGEAAIGNHTPAIREHLAAARDLFDRRLGELEREVEYRAIPIRSVVAVQFGAVLSAAGHLRISRP
jgi:hypothetical protein